MTYKLNQNTTSSQDPPKKVHACQQHQELLKLIGMREEMNTNIEKKITTLF